MTPAKKNVRLKRSIFPVVGIGASAGGLEAFVELLKNIPTDTGMAFVLVQHLDPTHKSMLTEIISRITQMPAVEVKNGMPVQPDHVYIIPPNKNMTISRGKFRLVSRTEKQGRHLPIDLFLSSLAKDRGHQAIGVILSGTATDGVNGQKAVKASGGITFSQDPKSAQHDSMPKSAIASGSIDFVLRPKAIARELIQLSQHFPLNAKVDMIESLMLKAKGDLPKIFVLLKHFKGVDFHHYKKATVERRVKRRMVITKKETVREYLKYLRCHREEIDALFQDLLISVTSFFRDPKLFQMIEGKIFPAIMKKKKSGQPVRIWVPACSTGEEAYSLAISLLESLGRRAGDFHVQVFATDVNAAVIEKARRGLYPESIKADVPPLILRRYFTKEAAGYRIIKSVRDMCVFAVQDLTRDPPFSKIDVVSCRNMLIYMDPKLQKKIITLFHYSLNPSGALVLGSVETAFNFTDLFLAVDKKFRIYTKKSSSDRPLMRFESGIYPGRQIARDIEPFVAHKKAAVRFDVTAEDDQAKEEELRSALEEIQSANEELQSSNEELETFKEELQATNEELITLNDELNNRNAELAKLSSDVFNLFNSTRIPVIMVGRDLCIQRFTPMAQKVWNLIPSDIGRKLTDINPNIKAPHLEEMFFDAIDHLKTTVKEIQDKEGRWYSMTVNPYKTIDNKIDGAVIALVDIHPIKIAQEKCAAVAEYFENVVGAVPEALIVLDKDLRVQTANKSFYKQFKVTPKQTHGQLIYDLGNRQWDIPVLRKVLKEVFSKKTPVVDYEISHKFPLVGKKVLLLNATSIVENLAGERLILVGMKDVTERKAAEDALRSAREEAEAANRFKTDFLTNISHDLRTPLNAILGFAHMLKAAELDPKYKKGVDFINERGKHLMSLVEDILDVSKMDSGSAALKNEEFDFQKLLQGSVESARSALGEKDVTIVLSIKGTLPRVKGDANSVQRIVDNLLSNAVKYTERGEIVVTVGPDDEQVNEDNYRMRISVRDTGFGIAAESLPYVFDPFSRFHEFYKGKTYDGVGLGLHIVHKLVSSMGGNARVLSEVGKGSEFIVTLNFKKAD